VTLSYDQARQFGKTYVGALNTGTEAFAALFAPDAQVRVGGAPSDPRGVRDATPAGRSGFRGARLEPPQVVLTVRSSTPPRRASTTGPTVSRSTRTAHHPPGSVVSPG